MWRSWCSRDWSYVVCSSDVANVDGRLELFVVGGDGVLYHKWQAVPNGTWGDWYSAGGTALSEDLRSEERRVGRVRGFVGGGDGWRGMSWQTSGSVMWWCRCV